MSATLMGAVMNCGPKQEPLRYTLLAIADNADDYGFACPSVDTIAGKVCRDKRTALRRVQRLECDGWIKVRRRAMSGRWSVYFLNLEKLGVTVGAKSRKSPLHAEIEKKMAKEAVEQPKPDAPPAPKAADVSGDKMSPEMQAADVEDFVVPEISGDNPQGGEVTKAAESGDKKRVAIWKNRCEPLRNPNTTSPVAPVGGGVDELVRRECEAALLECGISNPRMLKVMISAMRMQMSRERMAPVEVRMMMVESWRWWKVHAEDMRHSIGPRKFFGEPYWLDEKLWPVDHGRLEQERQRRSRL